MDPGTLEKKTHIRYFRVIKHPGSSYFQREVPLTFGVKTQQSAYVFFQAH